MPRKSDIPQAQLPTAMEVGGAVVDGEGACILMFPLDGTSLIRDVGPHEKQDLGLVTSLRHAETIARIATGRTRLQFFPHPALSTILPLWGTAERFSTKTLRAQVARRRAERGEAAVRSRTEAARGFSEDFAGALDDVSWDDIHGLKHSSSRQRLQFFRVKGLWLSGWDALHERRGCPHCPELGAAGGSTHHIVWACPAAQRLWSTVRSWWMMLGLWSSRSPSDDRDFLAAVFSLRLPRKVWDMVSLSQRSPATRDAPDGPYPALQAMWQQIVLETIVVILNRRHGRSDPERSWSPVMASTVHDASCQRVLETLAHRCSQDQGLPSFQAPLVLELRALFANPRPVLPAPTARSDAVHVLFFDGGSRGNPGPGGSGACVVRVGSRSGAAEIVWSAAISHAHPSTTNNQAEYGGLLAGLRAARRYRWPKLEVVGDSALILRQLRDYRPPKNLRLLRLYSEARRLADCLEIRRWTHHVRANNRMADIMANHAMDTVASSQVTHPTIRPGHADLHAHLGNDLRPWLASFVSHHVDSFTF